MFISKSALLVLLPFLLQVDAQSGSGKTTRYWDCCKPSCAWPGKASLASGSGPARTCDKNDNPVSSGAKSGCESGGTAYMCTNQMPWAVNDNLAYGFGAVSISGGTEASWCCACYELTFTSGPVAGKKMVIQATNTGGDLGNNHFDLAMPGGGFGIFNGCTNQFGTPSTGWGAQYGGVSSRSQCDAFDSKIKAGCYWRFDWFQNADNPNVNFRKVTCPAALTSRTGCVRSGETPTNDPIPTQAPTSRTTTQGNTPTTSPGNGGGSGTVAQYGQCGGEGWTGPTVCVSPFKCVANSQYYSQCL